MRILPLFFLAMPLAEIVTFGLVVEWLGFWRALGLVVFTSLIGFLIVRHEGFGLISKITGMAREGKPPASGISYGLITMLAGLLLLIPGFLTDIAGLLLLVPFIRNRISRIPEKRSRVFTSAVYTETYEFRQPPQEDGSSPVVDLDQDDYSRSDKGGPRLGPRGERD